MVLMEVECVPTEEMIKNRAKRKPVSELVKSFIDMNVDFAQVIIFNGEYKNFGSAARSIRAAVEHYGNDEVEVTVANKELYLVRKRKKVETAKVKPKIAKISYFKNEG